MKHIEPFSSEEEIQIFWKESQGLKFVDEDGRRIFIAHPGIKSKAGPDFKNAVIFVNDIKIEGDVECHLKLSDWFAHKHDENPEFSSVKIHVVWKKDCEVNGITISLENISLLNSEKKYLCEKIDDEKKRKEIFSLGKMRILRKSERIKERISEINDERQAVYEFLAEALGYERARNFMLHIARKYPLSYVERIDEKSFTDIVLSEIKNFGLRFRGRPKNYPLQRARALYYLFTKKDFIGSVKKLFESRKKYQEWGKNLAVGGLGKGRLRTAIANVILPYLLITYPSSEEIFEYFSGFPQEEENRFIREGKKVLRIKRCNLIEGQGLIEIYRMRCSRFLCYVCGLGGAEGGT